MSKELISKIPDKKIRIALALEFIIELSGKWQVTKNQHSLYWCERMAEEANQTKAKIDELKNLIIESL
jgi:uncharacterized beta-barrel protein YwiB (DUF1934 family)